MAHAPFPAGRWRHAPFPPVGGIIGARTVPSRWRDQQCGGNSASRWRRCCGCSASRWRLSASHWRRGRWRLPPRQEWRWRSAGSAGRSASHWRRGRWWQQWRWRSGGCRGTLPGGGLNGAFSSSARRRIWPALVLPHCSSRKSWPTRRVGRKINEPAVGGSLPSSRWRFSSLAWMARVGVGVGVGAGVVATAVIEYIDIM